MGRERAGCSWPLPQQRPWLASAVVFALLRRGGERVRGGRGGRGEKRRERPGSGRPEERPAAPAGQSGAKHGRGHPRRWGRAAGARRKACASRPSRLCVIQGSTGSRRRPPSFVPLSAGGGRAAGLGARALPAAFPPTQMGLVPSLRSRGAARGRPSLREGRRRRRRLARFGGRVACLLLVRCSSRTVLATRADGGGLPRARRKACAWRPSRLCVIRRSTGSRRRPPSRPSLSLQGEGGRRGEGARAAGFSADTDGPGAVSV